MARGGGLLGGGGLRGHGELRRNVLAVDKAARLLGWRPRVTLAEGLQLTLRSVVED